MVVHYRCAAGHLGFNSRDSISLHELLDEFHPCRQRHPIGHISNYFQNFNRRLIFFDKALVFMPSKSNFLYFQLYEDLVFSSKLKRMSFLISLLFHTLQCFL